MYHRLDRHVFANAKSNVAKFLMLCALRKALKDTDQFRKDAKGIVVCVVDQGWIWYAKSAANLLMTGGRSFIRDDDFRSQVYVVGDRNRRSTPKTVEDIVLFRPEHQAIYISPSSDDIPTALRLAADAIIHVAPPCGRHILAARRLLGVADVDLVLADEIAGQVPEVVIGLTARNSLAGFDLSMLTSQGPAPSRSPTLAQLPGFGAARPWVGAIKKDVADWREGRLSWSQVDRGVILIGPPGTGKTLFATALANELGFDLVATSVGEWQGSQKGHLGDTLSAMSKSFADASSRGGAVLFVDELDAIGDRARMRSDHSYYEGNVIGRFLELTTHALQQEGTVVVGASNYGHLIDPAILRSGRLEEHVHLDLPEEEERAEILSYHLDHLLRADELRPLTDNLMLASPADLEKLARQAKRAARRRGGNLAVSDVSKVLPAKVQLPEQVVHRICVHEMGHALMAMASGMAEDINIRVESHMVEGAAVQDGGRVHYRLRDQALPTDRDLLAKIRIMLGGAAAEDVVFGYRSIGAGGVEGSDLDQATRLAYMLAGSYGLGKSLRYQVGANRVDAAFTPSSELRAEVDGILAKEYKATKELLTKEKARLMRLAAELVVDRKMRIEKT